MDFTPGESARAYQRWVAIFSTPDAVSGYREVAYPKMLAARRQADELLSMGFYEEVSAILDRVPPERQTMLFSATLPPGVEGLFAGKGHGGQFSQIFDLKTFIC